MPSWSQFQKEFQSQAASDRGKWMDEKLKQSIKNIAALCEDRNVIYYGSAFLQKPEIPASNYMITYEDLNGFMAMINGLDSSKGLTLILHTPGGVTNAAESIVEYLRTKFAYMEVIVPTYAMSAGTMISLASNKIILGRQSQLGPIDPQMAINGKYVPAQAIIDQFKDAQVEILKNTDAAHLWAPILQSLGPALLKEAQNEIAYSGTMVDTWLSKFMFKGRDDAAALSATVTGHFNGAQNKSHGRRIDIDEARNIGVLVEKLEDNPLLQDAVLSSYHIMTILMNTTPVAKLMLNQNDQMWVKSYLSPDEVKMAQELSDAENTESTGPSGTPKQGNRAERRARKK